MEEALTALILADAGVTALVQSRVHWLLRPQANALPSITLQVITSAPVDSDEGDSGLVGGRVQADCWGATALGAKSLAREIKRLLSGRAHSQDGIVFSGFFTEDESDDYERNKAGADIYRVRLDFTLWYYS